MNASKPVIHIVSHTHWDREWYMPYEAHHVKLIETMDTLLQTFEEDPEFRSFYLDGQTIVLEDYLQIYPEKRALLEQLVQEGKLSAGPWYILQDEFLTSSEANIRNLQIGHRDAEGFGPVSKLGYFPDSFGNMGQAAQILRQAGIDTAVFGRGVKATGFNNQVEDSASLESPFSELYWESPDGSRVLGILFANWYNNGMEIPVDREEAKRYWDHRIAAAERYASTPHLLLMNGCDHQPVQTDLSEAIRVARELYPDYEFIHSNFDDYVSAVQATLPEKLSVTRGELRGQRTDGWFTLANTASARVYIKQLNTENQTMLEKVAEPLAAVAQRLGKPYPHALLQYAWKTLMQNHPHDSICGCSVDEVYHEMKTRFAKSTEVARALTEESAKFIAAEADTSSFSAYGAAAVPFLVLSSSGYEGKNVVTVEVEWSKRYFNQSENPIAVAQEVTDRTHAQGYLVNSKGERIAYTLVDLGVRFGYDLPKDKFRAPYYARALQLTFETDTLPAIGFDTYAWVPDQGEQAAPADASSLVTGSRTLENGLIRVVIQDDGSYDLFDKRAGEAYAGLGVYENVGDIGNEYIFMQPHGDVAVTSQGAAAEIRLVEDTPYRAAFEIVHTLMVSESADERLAAEVATMVPFQVRQARRSGRFVPLRITTRISLDRSGKGVRVRADIDNQSKDHRLRVLVPAGVDAATHFADSIFEVAERYTTPAPEWQNPSNCQHMQAFIDVHDDSRGLVVAGKGLNEYEVLQDGSGTMAVTLLRSVGELGDWGVFPTPDAQCIGQQYAEWMVIPHGGERRFDAYQEAYRFQVPNTVALTSIHAGSLSVRESFLDWKGERLAFSSLKVGEASGDWMARWYNLSEAATELALEDVAPGSLYASNVLEQAGEPLAAQAAAIGGYAISTFGIKQS
ncbi:glycoside hydrolase family 38 [Paenibacillus curdlanolyticus YK9]|uniref:Glycoside hydrolase family 38 n=1 Tax=Paenibacillus curdlanolyticus YK9 TaxID=717606 RepID=E0I879_9BACL|nr:alpha-mannosidase [Paenibacillus curdlanolyticus]EFM11384.1 glycoside hydrolase family 38 [Paenibacillus curdlanolyticus YK9]